MLRAENLLLRSQLADMKAIESDSQATIQNQEITINSLKKEKEVCSFEFLIVNFEFHQQMNGKHETHSTVVSYL